jgi:hypothetical protein
VRILTEGTFMLSFAVIDSAEGDGGWFIVLTIASIVFFFINGLIELFSRNKRTNKYFAVFMLGFSAFCLAGVSWWSLQGINDLRVTPPLHDLVEQHQGVLGPIAGILLAIAVVLCVGTVVIEGIVRDNKRKAVEQRKQQEVAS